jgi:hypothetical protein
MLDRGLGFDSSHLQDVVFFSLQYIVRFSMMISVSALPFPTFVRLSLNGLFNKDTCRCVVSCIYTLVHWPNTFFSI